MIGRSHVISIHFYNQAIACSQLPRAIALSLNHLSNQAIALTLNHLYHQAIALSLNHLSNRAIALTLNHFSNQAIAFTFNHFSNQAIALTLNYFSNQAIALLQRYRERSRNQKQSSNNQRSAKGWHCVIADRVLIVNFGQFKG
ncbi:MAG: hypothetical protein AB4372_31105 [Xenococcus sp. (in: cyanobacteria)]